MDAPLGDGLEVRGEEPAPVGHLPAAARALPPLPLQGHAPPGVQQRGGHPAQLVAHQGHGAQAARVEEGEDEVEELGGQLGEEEAAAGGDGRRRGQHPETLGRLDIAMLHQILHQSKI